MIHHVTDFFVRIKWNMSFTLQWISIMKLIQHAFMSVNTTLTTSYVITKPMKYTKFNSLQNLKTGIHNQIPKQEQDQGEGAK
jgi:hypothetical protein